MERINTHSAQFFNLGMKKKDKKRNGKRITIRSMYKINNDICLCKLLIQKNSIQELHHKYLNINDTITQSKFIPLQIFVCELSR